MCSSDLIILATKNGIAVRFEERDVRATGRSAQGVRGISLKDNDEVIGMVVAGAKSPPILSRDYPVIYVSVEKYTTFQVSRRFL